VWEFLAYVPEAAGFPHHLPSRIATEIDFHSGVPLTSAH
jgi:hypothetical protein